MQTNEDGWEVKKWSKYLPDTITAEEKAKAYADGLKRYCVASNFKDNDIANCTNLKTMCNDSLSKNECNSYLWLWCSDRNWNYKKYPQCGPAMVSRYVVDDLKSTIWEKEVKKWCEDPCNEEYSVCIDLGFKHEGDKECLQSIDIEIYQTGANGHVVF